MRAITLWRELNGRAHEGHCYLIWLRMTQVPTQAPLFSKDGVYLPGKPARVESGDLLLGHGLHPKYRHLLSRLPSNRGLCGPQERPPATGMPFAISVNELNLIPSLC